MALLVMVMMMLLGTSGGGDIGGSRTVEEICLATANPKLCESSVRERVKGKATAGEVLTEEVRVAAREMERAEGQAEELAREDKGRGDLKRDLAFRACSHHLGKAQAPLKEAAQRLATNNTDTLDALLAVSLHHLQHCNDAFLETNLEPALQEITHHLHRLIANCQTLVRAITSSSFSPSPPSSPPPLQY